MADSFFPEEEVHTSEQLSPPPDQPVPGLDEPSAPAADELASDESRLAALIAYIPFLCFIPLLNMRENKVALFHARQGTILFLIELAAAVLLVDGISDFIFKAILVGAVILAASGIYFALQGKSMRLPIIGDLADKTKL
jgi:uncharacterized membrane protein